MDSSTPRILRREHTNMTERDEKLEVQAMHLNNESGCDGESKEDKGDILGVSLEKLNLGPAKKLLVLNLDGELYGRAFYKNKKRCPLGREADAESGNFLIFNRPYCKEFLKFCFERFEVGIWASARMHTISDALTCVMGEYKSKLLFIWDRDHCTDSGFKTPENKFKIIFFKKLKKLWDSSKCKGKYSSANTLMIDDKPFKALLNPPYTAIFPDGYKPTNATDTALGANGELRLYLEGLADADDVPTYVKEHPFGQPAITAAHPEWEFYSMVVSKTPEDEYDCFAKDYVDSDSDSDYYVYDSDISY